MSDGRATPRTARRAWRWVTYARRRELPRPPGRTVRDGATSAWTERLLAFRWTPHPVDWIFDPDIHSAVQLADTARAATPGGDLLGRKLAGPRGLGGEAL